MAAGVRRLQATNVEICAIEFEADRNNVGLAVIIDGRDAGQSLRLDKVDLFLCEAHLVFLLGSSREPMSGRPRGGPHSSTYIRLGPLELTTNVRAVIRRSFRPGVSSLWSQA